MKVTEIFNAEALVCVEIVDNQRCKYLSYQQQRDKTFWKKARPEGFVDVVSSIIGDAYFYTEKDLLNGKYYGVKMQVFGHWACYRPYVKLTFAAGKVSVKEFDLYEDAVKWGTEQAKLGIKVQIII